jgi:hypothetical protein
VRVISDQRDPNHARRRPSRSAPLPGCPRSLGLGHGSSSWSSA